MPGRPQPQNRVKHPPEVAKAEGQRRTGSETFFWSELYEWELMKPFLRFLLLIFLAARKCSHGQWKVKDWKGKLEISLMNKGYSCQLPYENIHLGYSIHCPLLWARHCIVAKECSVEKEPYTWLRPSWRKKTSILRCVGPTEEDRRLLCHLVTHLHPLGCFVLFCFGFLNHDFVALSIHEIFFSESYI